MGLPRGTGIAETAARITAWRKRRRIRLSATQLIRRASPAIRNSRRRPSPSLLHKPAIAAPDGRKNKRGDPRRREAQHKRIRKMEKSEHDSPVIAPTSNAYNGARSSRASA